MRLLVSFLVSIFFLVPSTLGSSETKPKIVFLFISGNFNAKEDDNFAEETEALANNFVKYSKPLYDVKSKSLLREQCRREPCLDGFAWLGRNCNPNDLAVVYIGTHGGDKEDKGFCFFGTDKSSVTGKEIKESLSKLPCNLLLIVDTCHSGAMVRDWSGSNEHVSIITSCRADEIAYTWQLTPAMIEAIQGAADYNGDKVIDMAELRRYLPGRVLQLNNKQHVVMSAKHPFVKVAKVS